MARRKATATQKTDLAPSGNRKGSCTRCLYAAREDDSRGIPGAIAHGKLVGVSVSHEGVMITHATIREGSVSLERIAICCVAEPVRVPGRRGFIAQPFAR